MLVFCATWPIGCEPVTIGQRQRWASTGATMLTYAGHIAGPVRRDESAGIQRL